MKEITSIVTAQFTTIAKLPDDKAKRWEEHREECALEWLEYLKKEIGVDDVKLLEEKAFIRDVEGEA